MPKWPDINGSEQSADDNKDVWKRLAEHRDVLEMCVEEDLPFADRAKQLLEALEQEGY